MSYFKGFQLVIAVLTNKSAKHSSNLAQAFLNEIPRCTTTPRWDKNVTFSSFMFGKRAFLLSMGSIVLGECFCFSLCCFVRWCRLKRRRKIVLVRGKGNVFLSRSLRVSYPRPHTDTAQGWWGGFFHVERDAPAWSPKGTPFSLTHTEASQE